MSLLGLGTELCEVERTLTFTFVSLSPSPALAYARSFHTTPALYDHPSRPTVIDPQLTRGDRLVGQVLGSKGSLPSIYTEIEINYFLLRRLLGVKTDDKKQTKVRLLILSLFVRVDERSPSSR